MPGLVPGIHVFTAGIGKKDVDGRDKPGHDDGRFFLLPLWEKVARSAG